MHTGEHTLFDTVPLRQRGEFVEHVLQRRLDAPRLLRDWRRLGVACEAYIGECSDLEIAETYPQEALQRLAMLAEEALLMRVPSWV